MSRAFRSSPPVRRILHLSIDAFQASVEQALHHELRGRPIVVGGAPHECKLVLSCSPEARAHGVRPGMLLGDAAERCPSAVFRAGDPRAAARVRDEVTRVLLAASSCVEVTPNEDFYVDVTHAARVRDSAFESACMLRDRLDAELGVPTTWGVGTSKLVARVAGSFARERGVFEILPGYEQAVFAHLPLDELPGTGKVIGAELARRGVRNVADLSRVRRDVLYTTFGAQGLELHARAHAHDDEAVETTHALAPDGAVHARPPTSIHRSARFEPAERRRVVVEAMLAYLVERAASRLRAHGATARAVEIGIEQVEPIESNAAQVDSPTREPAASRACESDAALHVSRRRELASPQDATAKLTRIAHGLLHELPRRRALVRRVELALHDVRGAHGDANAAFDAPRDDPDSGPRAPRAIDELEALRAARERARRAERALDALRERHGFGRALRANRLDLGGRGPSARSECAAPAATGGE